MNGADASAAARAAYTSSPGYQFNLDQGLQALRNARAVNGTLASGNADTDAMKFASGLASQDYNNWLANLSGLDTKRYGATTGQAGTYGALGSAGLTTGAAKASLASSTAQGIGQAGANGLMAGQQAAANRFNAMLGGASLLTNLAGKAMGGGTGGYSIFGGGSKAGSGLSSSGLDGDGDLSDWF